MSYRSPYAMDDEDEDDDLTEDEDYSDDEDEIVRDRFLSHTPFRYLKRIDKGTKKERVKRTTQERRV